jgi:hypothetical protein
MSVRVISVERALKSSSINERQRRRRGLSRSVDRKTRDTPFTLPSFTLVFLFIKSTPEPVNVDKRARLVSLIRTDIRPIDGLTRCRMKPTNAGPSDATINQRPGRSMNHDRNHHLSQQKTIQPVWWMHKKLDYPAQGWRIQFRNGMLALNGVGIARDKWMARPCGITR